MGLHDLYMCLQLAVHVSLAALDWYVIEEAWWNTPATIFLPTPTTQVHSPAIRLLYITQLVRSTHLPFVVVVVVVVTLPIPLHNSHFCAVVLFVAGRVDLHLLHPSLR